MANIRTKGREGGPRRGTVVGGTTSSARGNPRPSYPKEPPQRKRARSQPRCGNLFISSLFFSPGRGGGGGLNPASPSRNPLFPCVLPPTYFPFPARTSYSPPNRSTGPTELRICINSKCSLPFRSTMGPICYTRNPREVSVRFLRFPGQGRRVPPCGARTSLLGERVFVENRTRGLPAPL